MWQYLSQLTRQQGQLPDEVAQKQQALLRLSVANRKTPANRQEQVRKTSLCSNYCSAYYHCYDLRIHY